MKQQLVRKNYRVDPDKLATATKVLGAASESEAVRMSIELVIERERAMASARKIMTKGRKALRDLAASDGEIGLSQAEWAQKPAMPRSPGKSAGVADLIDKERSEREESLLAGFGRGKAKHAGKRKNQ